MLQDALSEQERKVLVSIAVNLAVDVFIIVKLHGLWLGGGFDGPDGVQVWARAVLWAVPLAIAGTIGLNIAAAILHAIVTGQNQGPGLTDERDRLYEIRGMAATMVVATFGVLGGVIVLALGQSAVVGLTVIWFALAAGALAGDATRLLGYRVVG